MPEHGLLRDVHLRGSARVPTVALTFDDGPNGACTAAVLDALRDTGTTGTFFVLGTNVARGTADALLARMVRNGHTIGVHGWEHGVRRLFWTDLTTDDMARTISAIGAALARQDLPPPAVHFFRPPYGLLMGPTARAARAMRLSIVEWTVSLEDWRDDHSVEDLLNDALSQVRAGDVIVLHDGNRERQDSIDHCLDRPHAAAVVRRLVPALRALGLRVAPLADVLGIETPDPLDLVDSPSTSP